MQGTSPRFLSRGFGDRLCELFPGPGRVGFGLVVKLNRKGFLSVTEPRLDLVTARLGKLQKKIDVGVARCRR